MTKTEARKLKIGDRVVWRGRMTFSDTVSKRTPAGVVIDWEDGKTGWLQYGLMDHIQHTDSAKAVTK